MDSQQIWQQLVKNSILGSAQAGAALPHSEDPQLNTALLALNEQQVEQKLLNAAALLTRYRNSGESPWQLMPIDERLLAQCPAESRPYCNDVVANYLKRFNQHNERQLLLETLTLMANAQQLVPVVLLPDLMNTGVRDNAVAMALAACMGQRGTWLCRFEHVWQRCYTGSDNSADESEMQAQWHLSAGIYRQNGLRQARQRDPNAAAQLVATIWADNQAKDRLLLLEGMATGLNAQDLPWLQSLESDRSQAIRELACQYRIQLGDVKLQQQLIELLQPFIHLNYQPDDMQVKLVIELPKSFAESWQRYGMQSAIGHTPGTSHSGERLGEKAGWLYQLLQRIDPAALADSLNCPLPVLIDALTNSQHPILFEALDQAAKVARNGDYLQLRFSQLFTGLSTELSTGLSTGQSGNLLTRVSTRLMGRLSTKQPDKQTAKLSQSATSALNWLAAHQSGLPLNSLNRW